MGSEADLAKVAKDPGEQVGVKLPAAKQEQLALLEKSKEEMEHLKWLYVQGPSGRGRVNLGITNSTGCSSVWASTYPYNPYPFPWVNHLFQDAPSIAIGVFEGHMRKMGDHFLQLRKAEQLVAGTFDAAAFKRLAEEFDWRSFTDEEFHLCPPILSIGGDGAMMDIGFQNLSRLMASGKPIRVMVLDTQVYSNTGGQACTSGFTGQVADMSAWGKAEHGKSEVRKELAFIAMAHRGVFVHQSSQASASHLIQGVIKGLNARRPSVFNIYTPCPVEHGLADDWAPTAAKLALEARAFPFLTYDPDAGKDIADCLSLDGNPSVDEVWPIYELKYVDADGKEASMELPLTVADWAATEVRFRKNFSELPEDKFDDSFVTFADFVALSLEERDGQEALHLDAHGRAHAEAPPGLQRDGAPGRGPAPLLAPAQGDGGPRHPRFGPRRVGRRGGGGARQEARRAHRRVRGEARGPEGHVSPGHRPAHGRGPAQDRRRPDDRGRPPHPRRCHSRPAAHRARGRGELRRRRGTGRQGGARPAEAAPVGRQRCAGHGGARGTCRSGARACRRCRGGGGVLRHGGVDRERALHVLQRVHEPQRPHVRATTRTSRRT